MEKHDVWVMKLLPKGGIGSFDFCYAKHIVGFGWSLDKKVNSIAEYKIQQEKEGKYVGDIGLQRSLDCFEAVEPGNLIWVIDPGGLYYLCKIQSGYMYNHSAAHKKAGIINYKKCSAFYRIGTSDMVPEGIIHTMNAGGTIKPVDNTRAIELTKQIYELAEAIREDKN